jgi:uncharacterized membrane protein YcaP (DUF421 family)
MELVLRTAVVYVLLWAVIRGTGKRELSELGPFDLVLLIVLGDVVQQAVTQEDMSITGGLIVLSTMGLIVVGVGELLRRSARARRIIEGNPTTVVRDGVVEDEAMRVERLPMADLLEAARSKGIDDLASVRYAILEPNGRFSFITNDQSTDDGDGDEPDHLR